MAKKIECFTGTDLADKFDELVNESMTEQQQKEIGNKLVLDTHKEVYNELNKLKKGLGIPTEKYVAPDNSKRIKEIEDEYNKKIEDKKQEISSQPKTQTNDEQKSNSQQESSQSGEQTTSSKANEVTTESKGKADKVNASKQEVLTEEKTGVNEPPKNGEGTPVNQNAAGKNIEGITHAANEVRREDRALPEYEKEPQSFEQWNNEAEKLIKEGYNVEALMDKIEKGHDPTPVENAIRKIYIATLDYEISKNPTDALLAKQKRFIEIGDLANSRAGRNLVSLKGEGSPLNSISDFYVAKMEAVGVDKLTEQQKKETKEAFDNVQRADKNATDAMEAYREEISKLKAENELLKQRKSTPSKSTTPKTKEDYIAERQSLKDKLKQQVQDYKAAGKKMGIASDGGAESFIITAKMAKTIGEIVKSHVAEVGNNLKEVTKRTFEEIKDLITGITEKDIHNIIAGEYNEKRGTKNELTAQMRDLKDEAFYINKLDRLLSGEEPKSETRKVKRNRQITELQKKIKDFQKEQPATDTELKGRLSAIKTKNENETTKIKERIEKGDFETKKRKPFLEDPEMQKKFPKEYKAALDAIVKREDARHEFDIALLKDQMAKRSLGKKGIDLVGDIIGTTKALVTGIDASGIGIQNLVAMVAHPRSASKALPASFADFVSAKNQDRWLASVHNSELYPLAKKVGLDITEPQSLKSSEKEEIFTHNLLDRKIKYKGKTYIISKYITKPFERIFTGLGNRMRWNLFERGVEKLYEEGYTYESHPKEFESLAKVLNTETGRGKLHPQIDKAFNLVSAGIWSPRLMASRMNILGLGDLGNLIAGGKKGYYGGLTPRMRAYALKDLSKFVVFGAIMLGLAGLTFDDDDDDEDVTDIDPNSATFGTFLANGKRYNIWGGFTQYVRLMAKLIAGGEKSGGQFRESNQLKTTLRFLWSKTTPAVGTGIGLLNQDQKDYMGQPITSGGATESLLVPLSIRGIVKGIKQEGAGSILWTGVPSFVGMNVSYQSDFDRTSDYTKEQLDSPQFKMINKYDIEPPKTNTLKSYNIPKDKKHPEGEMTESEGKVFVQERQKIIDEGLKRIYKRGITLERPDFGKVHLNLKNEDEVNKILKQKKISVEDFQAQLKKEISAITTKATNRAKILAVPVQRGELEMKSYIGN